MNSWLQNFMNWMGKYNFNSDLRNYISHVLINYSLLFFTACTFKGQALLKGKNMCLQDK